jgi:hypothetical protein
LPWKISQDPANGLIELVFHGPVSGKDLRKAASECIALGEQVGAKKFLMVLSDLVEIELNASLFDLLDLPNRQFEQEGVERHSRNAVVIPATHKARESMRFYETASRNRGWQVRMFSERQEAVGWLMGNTFRKRDSGTGE